MPKPRVYIETTIPSFYFETRKEAELIAWRDTTRIWWDTHASAYSLCTSIITMNELAAAPSTKAAKCSKLMRGIELLDERPGIEQLIEIYTQNHLMPAGAGGDAGHVAFASLHGIDYLLTWNCKHLANVNKARHLAILNARMGLPVPVMTTPYGLLPEKRK